MTKFNILSLDGGGSKGVYTLGVLQELEAKLGNQPLAKKYDLIYGTSTGAIIAALIGLGKTITEIKDLYFELIPTIMAPKITSRTRSANLQKFAKKTFKDRKFDSFLTRVAIVTTNEKFNRTTIFKSHKDQLFSKKCTFQPGFGCKIREAVVASSAAVPFFTKQHVTTKNQGKMSLLDGGFVANNPSLYAITDAIGALKQREKDLTLLSVGCGVYPQAPMINGLFEKALLSIFTKWIPFNPLELLETTLSSSSNSTELLIKFLFDNLNYIRINDAFSDQNFQTNLLERNPDNLNTMFVHGQNSFGKYEKDITSLYKH